MQMKTKVMKMDFSDISRLLDEISDDRTVPRNVRNLILDARNNLNSKQDIAVKINSAISIMDDPELR